MLLSQEDLKLAGIWELSWEENGINDLIGWLHNHFDGIQQVNVVLNPAKYTLFPTALLQEVDTGDLISAQTSEKLITQPISQQIPAQDISVIYQDINWPKEVFYSFAPQLKLFNRAGILIEGLKRFMEPNRLTAGAIYLQNNILDIFLYLNGELQFANTFQWETAEDVAYFTILCLKQLGFPLKTTPIFTIGVTASNEKMLSLLGEYIQLKTLEHPQFPDSGPFQRNFYNQYFTSIFPSFCE